MKKIKVVDFFGGMEDVWLNSIRLNPSNINDFKLYLKHTDDEVDFYAPYEKKNRLFISHWKKMEIVSWFGNIDDKYSVAEERLQETIKKQVEKLNKK